MLHVSISVGNFCVRVYFTGTTLPDSRHETLQIDNTGCGSLSVQESMAGRTINLTAGGLGAPIFDFTQCLRTITYSNLAPSPNISAVREGFLVLNGDQAQRHSFNFTVMPVCDTPSVTFSEQTFREGGSGVAVLTSIQGVNTVRVNISALTIAISPSTLDTQYDNLYLNANVSPCLITATIGQVKIQNCTSAEMFNSRLSHILYNSSSATAAMPFAYRNVTAQLEFTCFNGSQLTSPQYMGRLSIQATDQAPVLRLARNVSTD